MASLWESEEVDNTNALPWRRGLLWVIFITAAPAVVEEGRSANSEASYHPEANSYPRLHFNELLHAGDLKSDWFVSSIRWL